MEQDTAPRVPVAFELTLSERTIEASVDLPDQPIRVADLLPVLHAFTDAIIEMTVDQECTGETRVTCGPGCGRCCRQVVPLSEAEAVYISELVAGLPAERQAHVRRGFRDALEKLGEPLVSRLRHTDSFKTMEKRHQLGEEYFARDVACPFLEDESCSIHPSRPAACREYLVTSPAANCASPRPGSIEPVPMPVKPSQILYTFDDGKGQQSTRWVPLVLALEWTGQHPSKGRETFPAPAMFRNFVRQITAWARSANEEAQKQQ